MEEKSTFKELDLIVRNKSLEQELKYKEDKIIRLEGKISAYRDAYIEAINRLSKEENHE